MEGGSSLLSTVFPILVLVVLGWFFGQLFPWRRLRRLAGRVSGDGGVDYLIYDVGYTVESDRSKRTVVELKSHFYGNGAAFDSDESVYITVKVPSPSPVADELHRIHNAGAMICSLRPAEKRRNVKQKDGDRAPVRVEQSEGD